MGAVKAVQKGASLVCLDVQLRDLTAIPIAHKKVRGVGPDKAGWASKVGCCLVYLIAFDHGWFQARCIGIDLPYQEQGDEKHRHW